MEQEVSVSDGIEAGKRYKIQLSFEDRSFVVEELDYDETKIKLAKLILSILGDAPKFNLERIIKNDRNISGNFSFELDKNLSERIKTILFSLNICLPLSHFGQGVIFLKLKV